MCPEAIEVISNNARAEDYNLSDCDIVFPIKIIFWGPSETGLILNMEMLQDRLKLEATKKYKGFTISGKLLLQKTFFLLR